MKKLIRLFLLLFATTLIVHAAGDAGVCVRTAGYDQLSTAPTGVPHAAKTVAGKSGQTCTTAVKRKIKVRFRARYMEFIGTPSGDYCRKPYGDQIAGSVHKSCLSQLYSSSFLLRGPPGWFPETITMV